ncbi:MAG TPA: AarF/ABC1/UbiB kinase family protein [Myxococcaceae bacterium]|nr:AarF/ABC1/UbiB kinase family protein [Myxococcaceae bacterium]
MNLQDLNRLRQIATIAARHGFADLLDRAGVFRLVGRRDPVEPAPDTRAASTARRFRRMLEDLGPTFVKLGQVLSTRADLLPGEFVTELRLLQDSVAPIPLEAVRAQIQAGLGRSPEEAFAGIDPQPLAAASIAQVHRATTVEGEPVVVKVQRPGIKAQMASDLQVLRALAKLLEAVVEETGIYSPVGIVEEFDRAIREELDFVHEAGNVHAFEETHRERKGIRIPRVHDELSSATVLTLEYFGGVKLLEAQLTPERRGELAHTVLDTAFRQLFEDGLFHADPHPGNFLLLPDGDIGLIDFGLVGRLTRQMREQLVILIVAVALKDSESVARLLYRIGAPDARANIAAFRSDIDGVLGRNLPRTLGEVDARHLLGELLDLAVKYRVRVPREYALLSRASISMEGILRTLSPDLDILGVALPYAKELLKGRYELGDLQGGLLRALLRFQGLAADLPTQVSQILLDLETGRFSVHVKSATLDRVNASLRAAAVITFLGLCACGFIVGAFISFAQVPWTVRGYPVLGLLGTAGAAALFGAAFTWYLFGNRFGKISLRRLLPGRDRAGR